MTKRPLKKSPCCSSSVYTTPAGHSCTTCNRPCTPYVIVQYVPDERDKAHEDVRLALSAALSSCMLMGRGESDPLIIKLRRAMAALMLLKEGVAQ